MAKAFLIEMGRHTQLPYAMFSTRNSHDDQQILWIQPFIRQNLSRELTTEMMARRLDMSVRNFGQRFRNAAGEAPSTYLQKLRIEEAKWLLETTHDTIEEIMVNVGYEDERSFRRLFRNLTDLSPRAYRSIYGIRGQCHCVGVPRLPSNRQHRYLVE